MASSLAPGTLVAGRYRVVRELGRGAMGAVYVAEHVNTGGLWALKVMLDTHLVDERAARFRREARASARIASEHVVKVTDADLAPELGGAPFLVMELLSGEDLERQLAATGPLTPKETLDVVSQVARGLEKAHAAGVIHRDLKPENVFRHHRDDGGTIYKVLDFGISKVLRPDGDPSSLSATGSTDIMGTPLYMAPEQAAGRHDLVGPGTDVWALALMTIRMLTGTTYWQGATVPEVFVEILATERVPPSTRFPGLSPAFDAWFAKSCAPKVGDRFQSVTEQVASLAVALGNERASLNARAAAPATATHLALATQVMARPTPFPPSGSSGSIPAPTMASTGAPISRSARSPGGSAVKTLSLVGLMVFVVATVVGAVLLLRDEDRATMRVDSGAAAALESPTVARDAALAVAVAIAPPPESVPLPAAAASDAAPTASTVRAPGVAERRPPKPVTSGNKPPSAAPSGRVDLFDTQN